MDGIMAIRSIARMDQARRRGYVMFATSPCMSRAALLTCRTCHKPVAYVATKCPHCGQDTPIWTSGDTVLAVIKLVVGLAMFAFITTCMVGAC